MEVIRLANIAFSDVYEQLLKKSVKHLILQNKCEQNLKVC